MSLVRSAGTVVLALLLVTTLVTANGVAAAHLTVLDPDFVTDSIEEEGGYEMVETAMRDAAGADAATTDSGTATGAAGPVNTSAILQDALSEEFVRSQTEANVDRAYAYLHGDAETLNLSVSTAPLRANVSAAVEAQLRNASVAELVERSDASLSGPVNATVLERMTANESSYEAVKTDLHGQVRERVLDATVNRTFDEASNDELVRAAGEDPDEYSEAQKERFVREHESEIKAALRERIQDERGDEIEREVDEQLATIREDVTVNATAADTETGTAVAAIQNTVAHGLTTDASYESFSENLSAAKADLAAAAADRADQRLAEELPARIDLTENAGPGAAESFEQARTAVQWLDRLAFVLPVVALALVGLLYVVRGSVTATASATGWSMLVAGVPTAVGVEYARSRLESLLPASGEGGPGADLLLGVADRAMGTVGDVALAIVVGGVLLVGGSLAVRYGLVERVRETLDDGPEDTGKL